MTSTFAFSFSGDDIDSDVETAPVVISSPPTPAKRQSAFPIEGKPQLPPIHHQLEALLATLPSKIAYDVLRVPLDDGSLVALPRRELWDVRIQLMAEDEGGDGEGGRAGGAMEGLGGHDVKTGVYEGGFKSWESSVDLVKVLAASGYAHLEPAHGRRIIELGCGTALPSLALFLWALSAGSASRTEPISFAMADYNPSVLQLVTLPNFLLTWALSRQDVEPAVKEAFATEGELELSEQLKNMFLTSLSATNISLSFLSGGWSPDFVELLYKASPAEDAGACFDTLVLGAETIYSPFALQAFHGTLLTILEQEKKERPNRKASAIVAAKRLYFGVGGSLDDFITLAQESGARIQPLREEAEGVRRGVVLYDLP